MNYLFIFLFGLLGTIAFGAIIIWAVFDELK